MRYIIICMAVLLCTTTASAGLFDFLNGPTTGTDWEKTSISDAIKNIPEEDFATRQEIISQGIAGKVKKDLPIEISTSRLQPLARNLSPLGDYYIRIDKAEYEPSTGMLKTYLYATRNGRELDIKNPVRWYGMGFTYAPDPGLDNINTGKVDKDGNIIWKAYEEENPRLALLSSIYSFIQTRDYGKVTNDGSDPTLVIYPGYDGYTYWNDPAGQRWNLIPANQTHSYDNTRIDNLLTGHATITNNFTQLRRANFGFNLTDVYCNYSISSASLSIFIYNSSPIGDFFYRSFSWITIYRAWGAGETYLGYDYNNYRSTPMLYNATLTNVTGKYTRVFITSPNQWISKGQWFAISSKIAPDLYGPDKWTAGKSQGYRIYNVAYSGTAYDPFLTIEYTVNDICPETTPCPSATTTPVCTSPVSENAGIPATMIYLLIPLAMGLSMFAVWSYDNRVYANIVLGGFSSSVLWFFLAANVITGNIFLCSANRKCILTDISLFWLFVLFGVVMTIYSLALTVEAIMERKRVDIGGEKE